MKIAALDIGGTSIKSGLWNGEEATGIREYATNAAYGGQYVMARALEILHTFQDFEAVGISTAGQVDTDQGLIRYANDNIPGYTGMKVREIVEREFGVPVALDNDVNSAAIGEGRFGAGKEFDDFLCLTYGTGVGGAIVINRKVYRGSTFSAGEFGGMMLHPEEAELGQPFSGCYEKYASVTALVRSAGKLDKNLNTGKKIFEHISRTEVREIVDRWIDEIVLGLSSLIHIFNPPCVILGGGVMAQPYVLKEVRDRTMARIMASFRKLEIRRAGLDNRAGLIGAASEAEKLIS